MSSTPPPATDNRSESPPMSPATLGRLHRGVETAVHAMWDNRYEEAEQLLSQRKDNNPRFALEWANLLMVQGLMNATNEQRESMLDRFKAADGLATAAKYGQPMLSDSEEEEDEPMLKASEEDNMTVSEKEKKRIHEASKKQRQKDKAEYKKALKDAAKKGGSVDQSWKLECDVIYADALLVRSLVQLTMNYYMRGGVNLRKTWGCYYALIKEVENDKTNSLPVELAMNIKYGCGVFYTYLALVPAGLMRLLSAIGFISDKELGEQYLTEVMNSGTIRAPFSALVLLTYYLFLPTGLGNVEETLSKAKGVLDLMNERYPNNSYFWGYLNFFHRKRGNTAEAVTAITKAITNAEGANAVPILLRYLYADTLYMDLQWAQARDKYKELLEMIDDTGATFSYTGQVVLSLAACYVMLGDLETAMVWVKRVPSMYNPKSKNDANSPKFANKVMYEPRLLPLIGVYVLYINRDLAHMHAPHVDKLLGMLRGVTDGKDMSAPEVKGMHLLFIGVMQRGCGRPVEAKEAWGEILGFEKKMPSDSMVLPYCYYEMGELEYREGNYAKAKTLFDKGQALRGAEGHETLANRYSIAMKQLKRKMEEEKK